MPGPHPSQGPYGHPLPHPEVLRWLVWEVQREGPDEPLALGLVPCWVPGARTAPLEWHPAVVKVRDACPGHCRTQPADTRPQRGCPHFGL